jgi:peptide/nickel transport system substrate-binding protein
MLKKLIFTTALTLAAFTLPSQAQEPRRGGTIRFTAPYAASFVSNDSHVSNQIQDEIYGYALHRSLYKWDSANNKPVLELAKSVHLGRWPHSHLQAPRRRVVPQRPQDDGRRHHLELYAPDGRLEELSRRRYVRRIKGATDVEKGAGEGNFRPEEDRRLHARDDPDREGRARLPVLQRDDLDLPGQGGAGPPNFFNKPIGLGPFKFVEHVPGSRMVFERWEKFYKSPASPMPTSW